MLEAFLEGGRIWSLISIVACVFGFLLGVYVYRKSPLMKTSVFFFRLMIIVLILGILDFLLMNSPDEQTARIIARAVFFLVVVMFAGYVYLSASLPYGRALNRIVSNPKTFWGVILIIAIIPAVAVNEMLETSYGWGVPNSSAMYLLILEVLVLISISHIMIYKVFRSTTNSEIRWQSALMAVGITIPLIYGLGQEVLNGLGIFDTIPILSPGFVISNIVFAYGILRYNLFVVSPVKEEMLEDRSTPDTEKILIPQHSVYLIKEKKSEFAYSLFMEQLNDGYHGLLISRLHPETLRERYGLLKTPIIWLAFKAGVNNVEPNNLSILQHTIADFIKKTERAVIMIDGLEYLISNNPVEKVLKLIYALRDEVADIDVKVLIPVDPETLDKKDLALFERECEVIVPSELENGDGKGRDRDLNSSQGIHSPTG